MANPTTNLGMTKPTVGGSTDTWGTTLNENVVDILDAVFASSGTAISLGTVSVDQLTVIAQGDLRLADTTGGQYVALQAHGTTTSYTLTMPAAVGSINQVLSAADGSGTLAWTSPEVGDITSVADATNGGMTVTNGTGPDVTLGLNFNDLSAAAVNVANDSIAIIDADDSSTKKESIADLATAMGGTGLTGASGTLAVDASQTQITAVGTLATGTWSADTVAVNKGGTGATSLTDGGILLGSGVGAITATSVLGDGEILIGDGTTDPVALDVGSSTAITILGTVATGVWNGTAIANANLANSTVSYGGISLALGASDATPAFNLSDATAYTGDSSLVTVGTVASGTWNGTAVGVAYGGTAISSYAAGDILYATGSTTLAKLAKGSDTEVLTLASGVPTWAAPTVGDITGVTAGTGLSGGGTSGTVTLNVEAAQTQITSLGTIGSLVATTADINGGTLDGATVGANSASTGAFTTITASSTLAVTGDTTIANGAGLVVGNTSQVNIGGLNNEVTVVGTGSADSAIAVGRWSADAVGPTIKLFKSRNTSFGSNTAVTSGDDIASIFAYGDDGTDNATKSSAIIFDTEGTIATGQVPGVIKFQVAAAGTLADALTLDSAKVATFAGQVLVNSSIVVTSGGTEGGRVIPSSANMILRPGSSGDIIYQTSAGVETARLANSGNFSVTGTLAVTGTSTFTANVGIGGSAGDDVLEVSGAGRSMGGGTNYNLAKFVSTTSNKGGILIGGTSYGANDSGVIFPANSTGSLNLNVGSGGDTVGISITSGGNVGIGTASPRASFDFGSGSGDGTLSQTVSEYQAVFEAPQGTGDYGRNIAFAVTTNGIAAAITTVDEGGSSATGLVIATGTAGSITEGMRIDSSQDITMAGTLDVTGNVVIGDVLKMVDAFVAGTGVHGVVALNPSIPTPQTGDGVSIDYINSWATSDVLSTIQFKHENNTHTEVGITLTTYNAGQVEALKLQADGAATFTGNVGIGQSAGADALEVTGTIKGTTGRIDLGSEQYAIIGVAQSTDQYVAGAAQYDLVIRPNTANAFRITSNGGSSSSLVVDSSGNTTLGGTLAVTGTSTLTGNVGIGMSAGTPALGVTETTSGTNPAIFYNTHASNPFGIEVFYSGDNPNDTGHEFIRCRDSSADRFVVDSNGGIANFQSNDIDLSDERLKVIHNPTASKWDAHAALEVIDYNYTESPDTRVLIGVGASQAGECDERLCATDGWDTGDEKYHAIYSKDLSFYTMKTVQECQARIEALEAVIAAL